MPGLSLLIFLEAEQEATRMDTATNNFIFNLNLDISRFIVKVQKIK